MRQDAVEHRKRLIEAARTVFDRDGYSTPLEAVLEEAGLGRGTLYRHFKNRSELKIAVFSESLEQATALVDAYIDNPLLFREFTMHHAMVVALREPATAKMTDHDRRNLEAGLGPLLEKVDGLFQRVITQARSMGVVGKDFDMARLRLATQMLLGAAKHEPHRPREDVMAEAVDLLLQGVNPQD